jgi:hypothetical protein
MEVQNTTGKTQEAWYKTVIKATSLSNHYFEFALVVNPLETFDFYEPLEYGKYVFIPKRIASYFGFESNRNHAFTFDTTPFFTKFNQEGRITYGIYASPKYRFSDKFSLAYAFDYTREKNDIGRIDSNETGIIFTERNREIVQNNFTGKYALNNKMTINLTARYYWSYADNAKFFTLQDSGYLTPNNDYSVNKNRNFNSWNFDLSYSWWFAPGSEISFLYRNYAEERTNVVEKNLSTNLKNVFNNNLTNIFSVSVRYFIDYNVVKNKF